MEQKECIENIVVLKTNAIVDPGAVVVESLDASSTDRAVLTAYRTDRLTLWAEQVWFDLSQHVAKVNFFILEIARILARYFE